MPPTSKAVLVAGALALGGMPGMGTRSASAQAPGGGAATYSSPPLPDPNPVLPGGARYAPPAARSVRAPARPAVPTYSVPAPAPTRKPSALRRFFTFIADPRAYDESPVRPVYVDPSTGRTDIAAASKPWMQSKR